MPSFFSPFMFMRKNFTLITAICTGLFFGAKMESQAQSLDPTFLSTTLKAPLTSSIQSGVTTLVVQPDGKVLTAGGFDFVNGTLTGKLQRFNADGSIDPTFNVGTGANGFVAAVAVQPDGRILVAGGFSTFNGTPTSNLIRLNADGSPDATFSGPVSGMPRQPMSLRLLSNGQILVSGSGVDLNGQNGPGLLRLNANGTKDPAFDPGTGIDGGFAYTTLVQPDGKILVGGTFRSFNGNSTGDLVRLNPDGSHDTSFTIGNSITSGGTIRSMVYQPGGKLLIGGLFYPNNTPTRLARLLPTGDLDNTFTPGTGPNTGIITTILPQASGAVLIGGSFTQYNGVARGRLARISDDGVLDPTFAPNAGANGTLFTLAETSTGQVLIGGGFTQYNGNAQAGVAQLSASGSFDQAFAPFIESRGTVQQAFPLSDGQLLIGGNLSFFNGSTLAGLPNLPRRLNSDGSLDASFVAAAGGTILAIPRDGAINARSLYLLNNSISAGPVQRLLPNGALDNSFAMRALNSRYGTSSTGPVEILGASPLPDGKLLMYGMFNLYDGVNRNGLVRLLSNGSLDHSFTPPASSTLPTTVSGFRRVTAVFALQGGKILYQWASFLGNPQQYLTRLNTDGSEDNTFSIGTGPANTAGPFPFFNVLPQPDGKLLISNAAITSFNGQATPYGLTRLTADGAVDPTFSGVAAYAQPRYVQADGKIIATMSNSSLPSADIQLVRLNADGSRDASFAPVAMPSGLYTGDDQLLGVTQQSTDGKLLLFGSFRYVAGQPRIGLARLTTTTLTAQSIASIPQSLTLYPNPVQQQLTVHLPAAAKQLRLFDLQGRLVQQHSLPAHQTSTTLDLSAVPAGLYLVQVAGSGGLYQKRVVVMH
jgi:uncharacterized delta-60 repeat protein